MPRIIEMWAYIVSDKTPDDEGIITSSLGGGPVVMPLVGADEARMRSLRPHVAEIAKQLGKDVRLIRFTGREEMEVISQKEFKAN